MTLYHFFLKIIHPYLQTIFFFFHFTSFSFIVWVYFFLTVQHSVPYRMVDLIGVFKNSPSKLVGTPRLYNTLDMIFYFIHLALHSMYYVLDLLNLLTLNSKAFLQISYLALTPYLISSTKIYHLKKKKNTPTDFILNWSSYFIHIHHKYTCI